MPPSPEARAYGKELRRAREQARLTKVGLARATALSARHLSYLEAGERRPRASTTRRLAAAIVAANPRLGSAEALAERLLASIGGDLAPESPRMERIERRRDRNVRRLAWNPKARLRPELPTHVYLARQLATKKTLLEQVRARLADERAQSAQFTDKLAAELRRIEAELVEARREVARAHRAGYAAVEAPICSAAGSAAAVNGTPPGDVPVVDVAAGFTVWVEGNSRDAGETFGDLEAAREAARRLRRAGVVWVSCGATRVGCYEGGFWVAGNGTATAAADVFLAPVAPPPVERLPRPSWLAS